MPTLNFSDGLEWGVRLFMGRNPQPGDAALAIGCQSFEDLRARLLATDEITFGLDRVGSFTAEPELEATGLDFSEGVRWAYRLALRREASDEDVAHHAAHTTRVDDLRQVFRSREFEARSPDALVLADLAVLRKFAPFSREPVESHSFRNFVGAATRLSFLHPSLSWKAGRVEGVTRPSEPGLHGLAEWIGSLRSVLEAKDRLVVVELGAGWGPWLVSCALAAKTLGVTDIRLVGVEGSAEHHGFMLQHFIDNGLNPDDHQLLHAVVGAEDGVAQFPRLIDPTLDYGAHAVFEEGDRAYAASRGDLETVTCIGLTGLLERTGRVDLLHMDIQGHERAVLEASMPAMNRHVHRAIVGTHSRMIDSVLLELFRDNGWRLEYEQPAAVTQTDDGTLHYPSDGEQVWRNSAV